MLTRPAQVGLYSLLAVASTAGTISAQPLQNASDPASAPSGQVDRAISILPLGAPSLMRVHGEKSREQPLGIFVHPNGPMIDFCSVGGCFDGPHLLTPILVNVRTQKDATAQEVGFHLNFTSDKGKVVYWKPGTRYEAGETVAVLNSKCSVTVDGGATQTVPGCLYRAQSAGTSAPRGEGPTGNGTNLRDGSIVWAYLGPGANNGKSAFSIAANFEPGTGAGWGFVTNTTVLPGVGDVTIFGEERDCSNGNKDSDIGSPYFMACSFIGGQGPGTFPMLAYRYVGSGAVNSGGANPYGAHYGDYWSGGPSTDVGSVVKDAVIFDSTNADVTLKSAAQRRHSIAFLYDQSDSFAVLRADGKHDSGLDFSRATLASGNFAVLPQTTFLSWSGRASFGWNGAIQAFTLGATNSGSSYSLAAYNSGDVDVGRHLSARPGPKLSISGCGASKLSKSANDLHGTISMQSGEAGCTIRFAATYNDIPDCVVSSSLGGMHAPAYETSRQGIAMTIAASNAPQSISYVCMGR
ncbi:exported protein of unknown function [Methylorubrum extorquens]|uniref:Uncharacterized protein n=1 Tax=Methylorubrum extorquens TaxID=408 RepID=A0A2N9AID2_METEX|nr:exported protein of unknown function [Methylorubrum extorquens]